MMQPSRHSLVWLAAPGWEQVQAGSAAESVSVREALSRWRAADWPLVVRRCLPETPATDLALGIALPPDASTGAKLRIAATVERLHVRRVAPALLLSAVLPAVPVHWRAALLALHMETIDILPPLRVFGSLSWQTMTGMRYLRSGSDIDLLFMPVTRAALEDGLDCLRRCAMILPLDGEIVFPCGAAVAWKEWDAVKREGGAGIGARVLTKHGDRVGLSDCGDLLASLDGAEALP